MIIATNWDGFGGRLNGILNAYYVSKRTGVDFKFIWPKEKRVPGISEHLEALSPEFRDRYLTNSSAVKGLSKISVNLDGTITIAEFLDFCSSAASNSYISIENPFATPAFIGDATDEQAKFYSSLAETIWSKSTLRLRRQVNTNFKDKTVLHARFGDLVEGAWKNYVEPSKYVTGLQIEEAIRQGQSQKDFIFIISDSPSVNSFLHSRQDKALVQEFTPSTPLSPAVSPLLEDLFKLEACSKILAPSGSAFSTLGAKLGAKNILPLARKKLSITDSITSAVRTLKFWNEFQSSMRGPLASRDIDQLVNGLKGIQNLNLFGDLTSKALKADPTNITSLCNHQVYLTLCGKSLSALAIHLRARVLCLISNLTHRDPQTLVQLTLLNCRLINLMRARSNSRKLGIVRRVTIRMGLNISVLRLMSLTPYQIPHKFKSVAKGILSNVRRGVFNRFENPHGNDLCSQMLTKIITESFEISDNEIFTLNLLESIAYELESSIKSNVSEPRNPL
jgi:hypothetical protein